MIRNPARLGSTSAYPKSALRNTVSFAKSIGSSSPEHCPAGIPPASISCTGLRIDGPVLDDHDGPPNQGRQGATATRPRVDRHGNVRREPNRKCK